MLEKTKNLTITMGMVNEILFDGQGHVAGIKTREGAHYSCRALVLTTGTFLNGLVHVGHTNYTAGRQGEEAATSLPAFLRSLALEMGRLKTGTPARVLRSSLDFTKMEVQGSDELEQLFEFYPHKVTPVLPCYITNTTTETHDIIKKNAELSPIYTGKIKGTAPRYCPSIEDKIARFPTKTSHHVFVEPESLSSEEMYPNGLSTALPLPAQEEFLRTIPGFENVVITRPGYAIEYDFIAPHQLTSTLEVKKFPGLFLAGQINGTTGYEEAAGQGIIAGINAHGAAKGLDPFILDRNESYIGIMINDLVSFGIDEPYRMFTSRAERRLLLRQDNAFMRLGERAYQWGLIEKQLYQDMLKEKEAVGQITKKLQGTQGIALTRLLSQGDSKTVIDLIAHEAGGALTPRALTSIYAELLYEPYLKREAREIEKSIYYQQLEVPSTFSYANIPGLSVELQQKLTKHRPHTIAEAALIPGMTPAAISLLIFKVRTAQGECHDC